MELQADAEHQQDDAHLGQLLGQHAVRGEAGRLRPDDHTRKQVADNRRKTEAMGQVSSCQGGRQAPGQREDQVDSMHQRDNKT
jgi:hypothetical protein